jgi:hypothetical protein
MWGPQELIPPRMASHFVTPASPNDTSSDVSLVEDYRQCVFVRGYRIRKKYKLWPRVIRAAAGPHDPPHSSNDDSEAEVVHVGGMCSVRIHMNGLRNLLLTQFLVPGPFATPVRLHL